MPRPRHINKAIIRLSSYSSRKSLCFDSKLAVVVVVIGLIETRLDEKKCVFLEHACLIDAPVPTMDLKSKRSGL